jgi:hypothetical protein
MLDGEKICYEASSTKFLIQGSETLEIDDVKNALQNTITGNLKYIEHLGSQMYYVEMENISKEDFKELKREWSAREDVIFTSPVFGEGSYSGYTNSVLVNLKSYDEFPVFEQLAHDYNAEIIYEPVLGFILPHNPHKDAMQVALELYETGLFVYAEPDFIRLWPWGSDPSGTDMITKQRIAFYPNPVNNILYVDFGNLAHTKNSTAIAYNVVLYNSQGNLLRRSKAKDNVVEINVSNLPNGIYFLHIFDENSETLETHKVFVKH